MSPSSHLPRAGGPGDRERLGSWLPEFLRRELTPYPGRVSLVVRMVAAATLTMLLIMTFHLPAGALGGYFALIVSRESLRNTLQQTWLTIAFFCLATVYVVIGVALFVDSPFTHFFWVVGSFYLIFFVMGTAQNYGLAAGFSFLIATAIPIWDRAGEVNLKLSLTLYILLSVILGTGCTLFVETVYRSFHPEDPVLAGIADRLLAAGAMLQAASHGRCPEKQHQARLLQYAMVGPSSLRRQLLRSGISPEVRARVTAVVAVTGRVVELCATALADLEPAVGHAGEPFAAPDGTRKAEQSAERSSARRSPPGEADQHRLIALSQVLLDQSAAVKALSDVTEIGQGVVPTWTLSDAPSAYVPILPELERSLRLLSEIFNSFGVGSAAGEPARSGRDEAKKRTEAVALMLGSKPSAIFVEDAFTNRDHLVFALRGCMAATLCYVIYNGIDWPGINTSVATCIITALGTIGSSRQKQLLRIGGAIVGGFLISLPAQVFLLPLMDSITSFTLFFAAVSALAAWFATSSPRLSYFGLQIALAFYLVNLQEPFVQISLAVARDRVVGVLLGLVAMWVVFDQIAAPLASVRMSALIRSNLELLGEMAGALAEVGRTRDENMEDPPALKRFRKLRDKINDTFSQMNAQADAVVFEFGRDRKQKLEERERMEAMQPAMRSLFLLEIALFESDWLPGRRPAERKATAAPAVQTFLERNQEALKKIAGVPASRTAAVRDDVTRSASHAQAAVRACAAALDRVRSAEAEQSPSLLTLCTSMVASVRALERAATGLGNGAGLLREQ